MAEALRKFSIFLHNLFPESLPADVSDPNAEVWPGAGYTNAERDAWPNVSSNTSGVSPKPKITSPTP